MSGLIWIQTVSHSIGTAERIFKKNDFEINQQTSIYLVGKELMEVSCIYQNLMHWPLHVQL